MLRLLMLSFGSYDIQPHPSLQMGRDATLAWASAKEEVPNAALPSQLWLFLYGSPSTGKTHLRASAFNLPMAAGRYPIYTLVPTLLDHVRQIPDAENKVEYAARFKAIKEAPILILDDLGAEQRSKWSDETLFKLLDCRYREALPTAVESSLLPAGLEPRIAPLLQDRALRCVADDRARLSPDFRQTFATLSPEWRVAMEWRGRDGKRTRCRSRHTLLLPRHAIVRGTWMVRGMWMARGKRMDGIGIAREMAGIAPECLGEGT